MTPEGQSDRDSKKAAEFAQREAERERVAGIDSADAGGRYLADAEAGRTYRKLTAPNARWREQAPTAPQIALLRSLKINPLSVRTRGEASDAIEAAKKKQKRKGKGR